MDKEETKHLEVSNEDQIDNDDTEHEVDEDEFAEKLWEELGVDPDENPELAKRLLERERANRKKLNTAIKQKVSWRAKATTSNTPAKPAGESESSNNEINIDELIDRKVQETLAARELKSLNLPDEIEQEVKDLAQLKKISISEAINHPYIASIKEKYEREERIKKAIPRSSKKGGFVPQFDPSKPLNPDDFRTPDGNIDVEAWEAAKAAKRKG